MTSSNAFIRYLSFSIAFLGVALFPSAGPCQTLLTPDPGAAIQQELNKHPGLLPEFGQLLEKIKDHVQLPDPRENSKLLPLLSPGTTFYIAFPNYGEAAHQALSIFDQELKESKPLRDWWEQGDMAKSAPLIESSIEKFYELSKYLGNEFVISGETGNGSPLISFVAEIRKPGLKDYLQKLNSESPANQGKELRVLDTTELSSAKDDFKDRPVFLVRADFVIAASSLSEVRRLNNLLASHRNAFSSTPFGERILQAYAGGVTFLGAADLQTFLSQTHALPSNPAFDQSGFKDAKYLVLDHKKVNGQSFSEVDLSFTGPRRGAAAWLAAPAYLGSLDFVSPRTPVAGTLVLKNPGDILDALKDLSGRSNPQAFASISQMEQALHISLRDDLLAQFTGELTFELQDIVNQKPVWLAILGVHDANRLQRAITTLMATMPFRIAQTEEDGIAYHSLTIPSKEKPVPIEYAFVDGYLILGSSHATAADAIHLHQSGGSLLKSPQFLAALPAGNSAEASALLYEDPAAMSAMQLQRFSPSMADAFSHFDTRQTPIVFTAYAEETEIRGVSTSTTANPMAILLAAAIAIPNVIRAGTSANESSAIFTVRSINNAQTFYLHNFPERGYAPDLATLASDTTAAKRPSYAHAGFVDSTLGNASCTSGVWCTKSGYRFTMTAGCAASSCKNYVITAIPVSSLTGTRSLCSTSDAVIRSNNEAVPVEPLSAADCRKWPPLE
jgi:hypothetical protein